MFSPTTSRELRERPSGVTAVLALRAVVSLVSVIFALLLFANSIPLSSGAFLLGGGMEQMGPLAFLIYAVITGLLGIGLWQRQRWAQRLTLLLAIVGVAFAVPAISSAVADGRTLSIAREGLQIMARVAVVFHLSQEPVKEWFAGNQ